MQEWIGSTIGKVRIEKYVARGGMAEIYLGTHLTLDRPVAVKILHSFIEEEPDLIQRFQREARVVASLRHPNIVQIFDFDTTDGHPYIVMEYLKGPSLASYLRNIHANGGRLPLGRTGHLLTSLASALDYAHAHGVIHRDVKPSNILLHAKTDEPITGLFSEDIEPILTDFGLVRIVHSATQTITGTVSGTPAYMSPEQARGDRVDHRTDIYSLGIVLYEMLAGRVPFEADSTTAILLKLINEAPPPIPGIPPSLQAIIDRALAKDPDERYQTCHDLAADFMSAIGLKIQDNPVSTPHARTPLPVEASETLKPSQGSKWKRIVLYSSLGLVVIVAGLFGLPRLLSIAHPAESPTNIIETSSPETPTPAPSFPPPADGISVGTLSFQDDTATLDQATINATLATPPEGTQYEAWLIGDEGKLRRSLGVLAKKESDQFQLVFKDNQHRILPAQFDHLEITVEPNPDNNPNSSGQVIYSSGIPPESFAQIQHLLVSTDETPNHVALVSGMNNLTYPLKQSADAMLAAYQNNDEANTRSNAEAIVNLIVGNQDSSRYMDWDNNGTTNDPGDGYGLLANGNQAGYIPETISYANNIATAKDATADMKSHVEHIKIAAQNMADLTPQLRDLAIKILQSPFDKTLAENVRAANQLAHQIYDGVDANGNGTIEPIPGEAGMSTLYEDASSLIDMPIFPGANQLPPPGQ